MKGTPGSSSSSRSLGSSGEGGQSRKGEVALDTGLGGERRLDLWVQMSIFVYSFSPPISRSCVCLTEAEVCVSL